MSPAAIAGAALAWGALSIVVALAAGRVIARRDADADDGQAQPDDWDRLVAAVAAERGEQDTSSGPDDLMAVADALGITRTPTTGPKRHLFVVPVPAPRRP